MSSHSTLAIADATETNHVARDLRSLGILSVLGLGVLGNPDPTFGIPALVLAVDTYGRSSLNVTQHPPLSYAPTVRYRQYTSSHSNNACHR